MGTQTEVPRRSLGIQARIRTVAGAVGLAMLGVVAGFASFFFVDPLYGVFRVEWPAFGKLLTRYVVQPGYGLIAAAYIWQHDEYSPLDRVQIPSREGTVWIFLAPIVYELAVQGIQLLPIAGLTTGSHSGGTVKWRAFVDQPELIVPGLVVMFLIMAPLEELLYRGVIHDRLEETIGAPSRVLVSGLLFGGAHLFFSGGIGLIFTALFGLLLAAGYERTDNLAVPIMAHAGYWLVFVPL